jgi:hypothetical protein
VGNVIEIIDVLMYAILLLRTCGGARPAQALLNGILLVPYSVLSLYVLTFQIRKGLVRYPRESFMD